MPKSGDLATMHGQSMSETPSLSTSCSHNTGQRICVPREPLWGQIFFVMGKASAGVGRDFDLIGAEVGPAIFAGVGRFPV
jgi:hypothetical protein